MNKSVTRSDLDVQVQTHGPVSGASTTYATQKIRALSHLIAVPVHSARVRLTQAANPAVARPAMAQASLDLDGRLLRAHVAAPTRRSMRPRTGSRSSSSDCFQTGSPCAARGPSWPRASGAHGGVPTQRPDYDFHLFTDLATGQDSVLCRDTLATYRLAQLHPRPDTAPPRPSTCHPASCLPHAGR